MDAYISTGVLLINHHLLTEELEALCLCLGLSKFVPSDNLALKQIGLFYKQQFIYW